jgi:Holliday junction resolvasome RuvABC DNA-binding subunit
MSSGKEPRNYSPHQQKIIKRYYNEQPTILRDRLAQLVGDLYLASGKSRAKLWKQAAEAMEKLGYKEDRITHVVSSDKPELLAVVVKELQGS